MEEVEIWKSLDFLGYPDYMVSNYGQVKSLERVIIYKDGRKCTYSERILKLNKNKNGYIYVDLSKNNKVKKYRVHRLVAKCFLEPIEGKDIVNHKDENKENNHVDNLEFCDYRYNNNYGTIKERKSESMKGKMSGENHPMFGKKHTEKTKQRISKANKGKKLSEEHKQKLSEINKGKHHTEEAKQRISSSMKGKNKGKILSEETKQKISEQRKGKGTKPILQYTKEGIFIRYWDSTTQANQELNIDCGSIIKCCKNKLKSAGGFIWCYKE